MEHPNAARFRAAHQALVAGDVQPFADLLADEVEWWDTEAADPIRGRAAVRARLERHARDHVSVELHDLFANDEHLVALIHATAERAGRRLDYSTAEVYHLTGDGLIRKRQAFAHDTPVIAEFFG